MAPKFLAQNTPRRLQNTNCALREKGITDGNSARQGLHFWGRTAPAHPEINLQSYQLSKTTQKSEEATQNPSWERAGTAFPKEPEAGGCQLVTPEKSVLTYSTWKSNNHATEFPLLNPPYIKYWLCFFLQEHN